MKVSKKSIFFYMLIFSFLLVPTVYGETVRVDFDNEDFSVFGGNSATSTEAIYFERPSSSELGDDPENPLVIFMPIKTVDGNEDSILFADKTIVPTMRNGDAYFSFIVEANNDSSDVMYLNAAIKNSSGNYESFPLDGLTSREIASATNIETKIYLKLDDLCDQNGNFEYCNEENYGNNDVTFRESMEVFLYLSDSLESGTEVEDNDLGLYVELKLSNKIPENIYTIERVGRGDNSLIFNVSGGGEITEMGDDFLNMVVFQYDGVNEEPSLAFGNSPAEFFSSIINDDEEDTINQEEVDDGEIKVFNLTNGTSYNFSFSKINKYLFLSNLSVSKVGTPQDIQTFLDEQACYLLSAGFQTDHFVLDFFRSFRDRVLLSTDLGNKFVQFYYDTAPSYTHLILRSEKLSFIVRTMGYFLYFIFKFWWLLAILPLVFLVRISTNHIKLLRRI